jgi:hypothetical protein
VWAALPECVPVNLCPDAHLVRAARSTAMFCTLEGAKGGNRPEVRYESVPGHAPLWKPPG